MREANLSLDLNRFESIETPKPTIEIPSSSYSERNEAISNIFSVCINFLNQALSSVAEFIFTPPPTSEEVFYQFMAKAYEETSSITPPQKIKQSPKAFETSSISPLTSSPKSSVSSESGYTILSLEWRGEHPEAYDERIEAEEDERMRQTLTYRVTNCVTSIINTLITSMSDSSSSLSSIESFRGYRYPSSRNSSFGFRS